MNKTWINRHDSAAEIAAAILLAVHDRGKLARIIEFIGKHHAQMPARRNKYEKMFEDDLEPGT